MPYSQYLLSDFITQISQILDDAAQVYWTAPEIQWAVGEALYVWGALTNYWRTRGIVNLSPTDSSPFYDLSLLLPQLRARTYTLGQIVTEIQFMLLEQPTGITGANSSGQVPIQAILNAVQMARNRFVLDTHLPITYHAAPFTGPLPAGLAEFPQASVFVHRVGWQDNYTSIWSNLYRADDWDVDKNDSLWPTEPGTPQQYSESQLAPLQIQISPPPINAGVMDALTVDSIQLNLTGAASLMGVPDEWAHAIKYAALSYLLSSEGQLVDAMRAKYAEDRYQQAVRMAVAARSITRLSVLGNPVNIDSLFNMDAGSPWWRNEAPSPPSVAGVLYDMFAVPPVDQFYEAAVDVVQSAPIPTLNQSMPIGIEDLDHITSYVKHILTFKCGGNDLKSTFPAYDSFMSAVEGRKGINAAKIKYLTPLFGQPQVEWAQRPDEVKPNA